MKVSVVICTYTEEMYEEFLDAVESVRVQTYDDVEIVIVVEENKCLLCAHAEIRLCRRIYPSLL